MNDFLTLLLPWQETSNNQISDYFVCGIGLSFIVLAIYFSIKVFLQYNFIKSLTRKIPQLNGHAKPSIQHQLKSEFERKTKFKEAWREFEDSLVTRKPVKNGDENEEIVYKTDEAAFYFSEDRLLGQYMNLRFWNSIPAILVGLGILGTFVGLVWGLIPFSNIDFQNTEKIQNAIKELLSGVSTAFVTSVWGMLTSLIFNVLEKWCISKINMAIVNLQRALDRLFTLTTQEEIAFRQEDELTQQTQALKTFSTDLTDKIKVAMDNVISEAQLTPNLINLETFIKELQEQSKLIGNVNQNLMNFQTHSVQSKQEIVGELQKLVSSIAQMETSVEKTVYRVYESIMNLPGLVEQIADDIQKVLNQTNEKFEQRLPDMDEFFDRMAQNLQDIQQRTIMLLQLQDDRIETINAQLTNSQTILDKGREMFEQIDDSITSVRELIETTRILSGTLKVGTDQLEIAGKQLIRASNMFNNENEIYLRANRETTEQIQGTLEQSKQLLNDFTQNFQVIDNSLNGIFEEIGKGLNAYADITRESIDNYLETFSEQLANASNSLASSINALKENVVILNDIIDQLRDV